MRICNALIVGILVLCSQCKRQDIDDSQIKETASAFKKAFIARDTNTLTSLLTKDAVDFNLTTHEATAGNTAVASYLTSLSWHGELSSTIEKITKKGADTVRVSGMLEIPSEKQEVAFKITFQKVDNRWLISEISHLLLLPATSNYDKLKGLEWLAGSWVNADEDTDFHASYHWEMNKNFLKEEFGLNVLGHKQLTGAQIIGWDPVGETIYSWIIDSDGGFGKSSWAQDDGSWYVTTSYTLADGSRSSATHIYKQIDADTYTFSSTSRDVDGRMLPNIGPFTIKRTGT